MSFRSVAAAFRCEFGRAANERSTVLLAAAALVLCLASAITSSEILIMVSGDDPYKLGGAIGFIGNLVDPSDIAGSSVRTAFSLTVIWIPICILYAVQTAADEYGTAAHAVSRARGISEATITVTKLLVRCVIIGVLFLAMSSVVLVVKMNQSGEALSFQAIWRFASLGFMAMGILWALFCNAYACQLLIGNPVVSSIAMVAGSILALVAYPSAYGNGAVRLELLLSPVFYLMNICSLCLQHISLTGVTLFVLGSSAVSALVSLGALRMRRGLQ